MTVASGPAGALGASALPDPSRCPLCGEANRCAMEIENQTGLAQPPCWCTTATFSAGLLQQIEPQARGVACVCANCCRLAAAGATSA